MALRRIVLATAFLAILSQAQPDDPPGMLTHEQLVKAHSLVDANKDGKMSMQELLDFSHKTRVLFTAKDVNIVFEEQDSDKDGKLQFGEILGESDPETTAREKAKFEAADLNKDGSLSKEEAAGLFHPEQNQKVLKVVAEQSFGQQDKDKDGSLTISEFWTGDPSNGGGSEEVAKEFKALDADGDGKLSVQEMMRYESGAHHAKMAMEKLIASIDKDSDGHITADELTGGKEWLPGTDAGYHFREWAEQHEL
eukprot:TRINITY_DN1805_c0_g2_i2.p1 TRINITY_DN1805_c0_g2~~TRINITY_DN1805_c0_g2_i2.p1  ORF type:complete len:270 (-),score=63.49 TRINITY_DN1805_c0_g2_i2:89-844(-)